MRRLHVVGLPNTQVVDGFQSCAYTGKVRRFGRMMSALGYECHLYAGDQSDPEGWASTTPCFFEDERRDYFGEGFNTATTPMEWNPAMKYWAKMNARAIIALHDGIAERGDLLLLIGGNCQQPIAAACDFLLPIEWGIGYEGIFSNFCAFESYAWQHHVYGLQRIVNGRAFDAVIPNYFDPEQFHAPGTAWEEPGDYLLYMGRMVERKGPHIAAMIAERAGLPIIFAGPGGKKTGGGITFNGGKIEYAGAEYVGEAETVEDRRALLALARALIVPTVYVEPFGGVAVEAMLAGTPVLASDWGAFCETVTPDVGRRFRTLTQADITLAEVLKLKRGEKIAKAATKRFGLAAVGKQFDAWFKSLETLWGEGYTEKA